MMTTSMARPNFSASSAWIASAFSDLGELISEKECRTFGGAAIPWIVALSMHGSADSVAAYEMNCRQLLSRYSTELALKNALRDIRQASTINSWTERAGRLEGGTSLVRSGFGRILTPNQYSRDYLPPDANRARAASNEIFKLRGQFVSKGCNHVAVALATYITLLTAHPLVDGNGRTARALFVADATVVEQGVSSFALAAVLLKGKRSAEFHLSAKCARAGEFFMLAECFGSALDGIARSVHPILAALTATPFSSFDEQVALAEEIHGLLCGPPAQSVRGPGIFG